MLCRFPTKETDVTALKMIPLTACIGLAACVSNSDAEETIDFGTQLSFAQLDTIETALVDVIDMAGVTPVDNIPDTGLATYNGTMTFLLLDGSEDGVIGQAEMNVNFGSTLITGGADNFYDLNGNATAGAVTIDDAVVVTMLGNFIAGDVNGAITFGAGEMEIETGLAGNFSGNNAEYVSGVMSGNATLAGNDPILVQGAIFAAE